MAKNVQQFRVTASTMLTLTGLLGQLIVNTTRNSIHVHDGVTPGGYEMGRADASNIQAVSASQDGKMTSAQYQSLLDAVDDITALDTRLDTAETDITALEALTTTHTSQINSLLGQLIAPSGTRMLFQQTSAPTGWTKETGAAYANAIFVGTILNVGTGGTAAVQATPLGAGTPTVGDSTEPYTLTIADMPSHDHPRDYDTFSLGTGATTVRGMRGEGAGSATYNTQNVGGGGAHSHDIASWDVKYAEVIVATKS